MKYLVLLLLTVPTVVFAQDFVSLTQIPQIQSLAQENNLAGLLNYVYLICIGIGASLAVFQFVRAGILYSSNTGSQSKVSEAKKMIGDTVFGLVLLLSPFVVFSLIDPRALDLSLNFGALRIDNQTDTTNSQWTDSNGVTHQNTFTPNSSLPQCQIGTSTFPPISDGFDFSLPSGQELADCCTNQGYNVVATGPAAGSSLPGAGNVECLSDEALAARQAQTDADNENQPTQGENNTIRVPWAVQKFGYIVYKNNDAGSCVRAWYGTAFNSAAMCQEEVTQYQSTFTGGTFLYNCTQNTSQVASVEIQTPLPLCN